MTTLLQDLRYGLRGMFRSPAVTAVAVLSLALGIGANTAIFSLVNALILRMLPVENPEALVVFGPGDSSGNSDGFPDGDMSLFSYHIYRQMQQKNQVFSGVAALGSFDDGLHGTVGGSGDLESMEVKLVSGTYFNVLGVKPVLGRVFTDADDQTLGGHPVAVISNGWWKRRFSRGPSIVGKTVKIEGTVYTIVGVAPPEFSDLRVDQSPDLWIPLQMSDQIVQGPHKLNNKLYRWLNIVGRLKPGETTSQASANVNVILKDILRDLAGPQPTQEHLQDMQKAHIEITSAATGISFLRFQFSQPLWMLMAIVALVLLIACANIANLLLARSTARSREIAVRMALGAGRTRLIRQLLTESLLLALFGGGVGVLFASWASSLLLAKVSAGSHAIPMDVSPDARVLAFTLLVCFATAILFGILPAFRATRVNLTVSLKEGRGAIFSHARSPLGKALIVSQVALSMVLLVGAGLFIRSLINLVRVDTGFNKQGVLLIRLDPSATGYTDEPRLANLYRQVQERVTALPGVRAASFSIFTFSSGDWNEEAWAEDSSSSPPSNREAWYNAVQPGYFATLGLPILAGRDFSPQDTATSPRVAVINETMARRFFPDGSPIGKRFGMETAAHSHDTEVIGVVRDAKYVSLDEPPSPMAYYPCTQYIPSWGIGLILKRLEVRVSGDPQSVVPEIRKAIAEANPNLPIFDVATLSEQVDESITAPKLIAQLSTFFGVLAVFLASIGIYGLMSYTVSRRTNEIGIRMALGASRGEVLLLVMREVVLLVAIGLVIGIPAALASGRWAASMLFGLKPSDPITLASAVTLLIMVAVFAGYLPARRASKVDPMEALRYE